MRTLAILTSDTFGLPQKKKQKKEEEITIDDQDLIMLRDAEDDEAEERDEDELASLEEILELYDPDFLQPKEEESSFNILEQLKYGKEIDSQSNAKDFQLHVNVERIRVPEVLYQPSMQGMPQAGLSEALENCFSSFVPKDLATIVSVTNSYFRMYLSRADFPWLKDSTRDCVKRSDRCCLVIWISI